jgi:hypothetical protein
MRAQMQREYELAHAWRDLPPPNPGHYLVRREIDDDGTVYRSCGFDYFDGNGWPTRGGYVRYTGWQPLPPV